MSHANPATAAAAATRALAASVRRATEADLPALLDLTDALVEWDRQFDPTLDPAYNRSEEGLKWMRETLAAPDSIVLVAGEAPIRAVLFGSLGTPEPWRAIGPRFAELEMLCVAPEQRCTGLGKALVDAFAQWARDHHATTLRVRVSSANTRALHFYHRELFLSYDSILERPL